MTKKDLTVVKMAELNFLALPLTLRGWFLKTEATAEVREDGSLWADGTQFKSLSGMANSVSERIKGAPMLFPWSGYMFWHAIDPATTALSSLDQIRHRVYLDIQEKAMASISRANVLMLRLKYGTITDDELSEFHTALDKLVWRNVWNHYCTVEAKDMNSAIWLRILDKCHTWEESRNLHVTTWIWRVAWSEIGKNRHGEKKRAGIHGTSLSENLSDDNEQVQRDVPNDLDGTEPRHTVMDTVETVVSSLFGVERKLADLLMTPTFGVGGKELVRMKSNDLCTTLGIGNDELAVHMRSLREKLKPVILGRDSDEMAAHLQKLRLQDTPVVGYNEGHTEDGKDNR